MDERERPRYESRRRRKRRAEAGERTVPRERAQRVRPGERSGEQARRNRRIAQERRHLSRQSGQRRSPREERDIPNVPAWRRDKRRRSLRGGRIWRPLVFVVPVALLLLLVLFFRPAVSSGDQVSSAGNFNFSLPWDKGKGLVMLDAGHGGRDQGTSYGDILEKDLTLEITQKVRELLEDADYQVLLTRSKDTFMDKHERADFANAKKPEVFVSIHCNFLESGQADGIETYYDPDKEAGSRPLAEGIQTHIIEETGATDRSARADNFVVITDTTMPAALVEVGFLSDEEERANLQDESYQRKLAEGIAAGILEYLEAQEAEE